MEPLKSMYIGAVTYMTVEKAYPEHVLDSAAASPHDHQPAEGHKFSCRHISVQHFKKVGQAVTAGVALKLEGCPFMTTLAAAMFFHSCEAGLMKSTIFPCLISPPPSTCGAAFQGHVHFESGGRHIKKIGS